MLTRLVLSIALLLPGTPALAQSRSQTPASDKPIASMEATSFEEVPRLVPMHVRPESNGALERDLIAVFEAALRDAGHTLANRHSYAFTYRAANNIGRSRDRSALQLQGEGGSSDTEDLSLTMRWRVLQDDAPAKYAKGARLLLIKVADPAGHVVWEATIDFRDRDGDTFEQVRQIAPAIVSQIGSEVVGRQLP